MLKTAHPDGNEDGVSLMATHTFAQIDVALEKFEKVGKALSLFG